MLIKNNHVIMILFVYQYKNILSSNKSRSAFIYPIAQLYNKSQPIKGVDLFKFNPG